MKRIGTVVLSLMLAISMLTVNAQKRSNENQALIEEIKQSYLHVVAGKIPANLPAKILELIENQTSRIDPTMDEVIYKYWDGAVWYNDMKDENIIGTDGNLTDVFSYYWNYDDWYNDMHLVYTYNAQGLPDVILMQMWDEYTSEWEDIFLISYAYNNYGNLHEILMQLNGDGTWYDFVKVGFIYNAQQQNTQVITMVTDLMSGVWENSNRYLYAYNANGWVNEEINQLWEDDEWINEEKTEIMYDAGGNETEELIYFWGDETWEVYLRYAHTYNAQYFLIHTKEEFWNGEDWENDYLYSYTYDNQWRISEELGQYWIGDSWMNSDLVSYAYGLPLSISNDPHMNAPGFELFPNPAKTNVSVLFDTNSFAYATIKIFNTNGTLVREVNLSSTNKGSNVVDIPVNDLPAGNYIMAIETNQAKASTQKLIIVR
jgi:hypothetical protein